MLFAAGLAAVGWHVHTRPGPLTEAVTVIVPRGSGLASIGRRLEAAGVVADARLFSIAARLTADGPLQAGEYEFPARISGTEVLALLRSGKTVARRLTVAEGLTVSQVLALVRDADGLSGEVTETPAEGSLLPETYHYSYGDSRDAILGRMRDSMERALEAAWPQRAPDLPLASPDEAVTLASIVERETGLPAERPRVAAVFINRLRRGMKIQSDPTVIYAVSEGTGVLERPLSRADLVTASPYNTYVHTGLPPGPIANPGLASIGAVLNPLDTDELYFVADGNGGHVFAKTLAEHNRNVARWRRLEREAREKD
ncbi:MAG: endolytic transglycosylase MltG [Rhodospirillales bacterium]|nr:endolytic transglycosylase MltG [Rhodospirillales bacterium]